MYQIISALGYNIHKICVPTHFSSFYD